MLSAGAQPRSIDVYRCRGSPKYNASPRGQSTPLRAARRTYSKSTTRARGSSLKPMACSHTKLRCRADLRVQVPTKSALVNSTPRSILRSSPRAPSRFPRVDRPVDGGLRFVFSCSVGQLGHRDFNARDSIQMDAAGRWMLVFMRVICAHAEAVEMRVGGVGI